MTNISSISIASAFSSVTSNALQVSATTVDEFSELLAVAQSGSSLQESLQAGISGMQAASNPLQALIGSNNSCGESPFNIGIEVLTSPKPICMTAAPAFAFNISEMMETTTSIETTRTVMPAASVTANPNAVTYDRPYEKSDEFTPAAPMTTASVTTVTQQTQISEQEMEVYAPA